MGVILTIAINTLRGFSRDRVFHATLFLSIALVLFSYGLSTLTIVESQKLLLDFGLAAVSLSGALISIFLGISAVSQEIQTKVIYSILSKPIPRVAYLIGKYFGAGLVVLVAHVIMSLTLCAITIAIGTGLPDGLFACFYLMFLESLIILAIALFSSIFSSTVLATSFTIGMFLIGRSAYAFRTASERSTDEFTRWFLRGLHDILPNLERYNIREVVAYSKPYPENMIAMSSAYGLVYITFFLAFSALLFHRKDLP